MDLDAALLEFLMDREPPPFALGSLPPPAILASMPPRARRHLSSAPPHDPRLERLIVTHITALPATPPKRPPPPAPGLTPAMRTRRLLAQLESVGPGDESPMVQSLLGIGEACLDALANAFPGLLWFDRRLPHTRVARGRDVSPLARVLVAFGARAEAVIARLLASEDREKRFYATLVAAEVSTAPLITALGELTLDRDEGTRSAAAGSLAGLPPEATGDVRARLRRVVTSGDRDRRVHALQTLALLRDEAVVTLAVELFDPVDIGQTDVVVKALEQLTAHALPSEAAWRQWVAKHKRKPRTEWLVEALDEDDSRLAAYAVRELERLFGSEIGLDQGGGKKERARAKKIARALLSG